MLKSVNFNNLMKIFLYIVGVNAENESFRKLFTKQAITDEKYI